MERVYRLTIFALLALMCYALLPALATLPSDQFYEGLTDFHALSQRGETPLEATPAVRRLMGELINWAVSAAVLAIIPWLLVCTFYRPQLPSQLKRTSLVWIVCAALSLGLAVIATYFIFPGVGWRLKETPALLSKAAPAAGAAALFWLFSLLCTRRMFRGQVIGGLRISILQPK